MVGGGVGGGEGMRVRMNGSDWNGNKHVSRRLTSGLEHFFCLLFVSCFHSPFLKEDRHIIENRRTVQKLLPACGTTAVGLKKWLGSGSETGVCFVVRDVWLRTKYPPGMVGETRSRWNQVLKSNQVRMKLVQSELVGKKDAVFITHSLAVFVQGSRLRTSFSACGGLHPCSISLSRSNRWSVSTPVVFCYLSFDIRAVSVVRKVHSRQTTLMAAYLWQESDPAANL